jgi:hypothetical protein
MDEDNIGTGSQAPFRAGGKSLAISEGIAGYLIYNTTFQVAWQVHEAWLQWMLDIYMPEILGTGCFVKHQLVRLLETDETDGPVYAVQYYSVSIEDYKRFVTLYEQRFKQEENKKWNGGTFSFSSLMQVVN